MPLLDPYFKLLKSFLYFRCTWVDVVLRCTWVDAVARCTWIGALNLYTLKWNDGLLLGGLKLNPSDWIETGSAVQSPGDESKLNAHFTGIDDEVDNCWLCVTGCDVENELVAVHCGNAANSGLGPLNV